MSRHDSAPTHGWVISSRITRWLSTLFVLFLFVLLVIFMSITYGIRRDCSRPYKRDLKVAGYWVHIDAGSTKRGCVQP
jgi:hypothetical protein